MFVKWSCWFLLITIIVLIDIDQTQCKSYSSRSSSSRTSSGSRSFGSGSHSSFGTSRNNGASRGSYGWTRTTSRPYTQRTTRRHYPVTTMPTRRTTRYHPITTMPTRRTTRYHPITTMPTRRTTQHHYPVTTMPTRRTTQHTRQPAFNPHYNNTSGGSHFGTTTKQPPFNPFFTTGHTRQPAVNPFFNRNNGSSFGQTTRKSIIGDQNNNHFRQTTPGSVFGNNRNNGSNFNTFGQSNRNNFSTGGNSQRPFERTTKVAPVGTGNNVFGQPNRNNGSNVNSFGHNRNNGSVGINRPFEHTTKTIPVGSGNNVFGGRQNNSRPTNNNNWRTTQRPIYTTTRYKGPSYNTSSLNHGSSFRPGSNGQNIYQPPSVRRNTTYNTGSGIHPAYPTQPVVHPSPTHHTTVINNNNNHYYGGSSPHYNPGYYTPPGTVHTHVTVINQHNYNHHVIVPSRHYYSYGPPAVGVTVVNSHYYDTYPTYHTTYHYSTYDTGSTSLGFFLGYQLGRITRPSYYYHSTTYVNDAYVPRYDHYTVHYYNYNSANIPKEAPIQPNAIVVCAGDSSALCPPGNMPLCTNNGAVMCVVNAVNSSPCSNDKNTNCVKSTIPCQGNNSPECSQKQSAEISIPCVSTASIPAGVGFVNNSVIVTDANDSTVKNFCVTVLALPSKNETRKNTTATQPTEPPPPFRYTTNHTGVDLLGYYLGRKLQLLVEPSFGFLNYDEQYNFVEKFDHYNIFHYYHDANILPQQVDIRPEQIMNCAGDSGTFCPPFTASLCLNDGAVTCVTDISNTSFSNGTQANYLNSTVSCEELKSPVCVPNQNLTVPIQIPCISTAKVYANVSYMIRTFGIGNNTQSYRTIELVNNTGNLTVQNITDPRQFCVAILALPGDKVVVKTPERRKVTGIENAPGYLALPSYSYKNISTSQVGAYLAYKLDKLRFPSYYWLNAYAHAQDGSIQKYDHYSVHHYFQGKEIIPDTLEFQAFDIRVCEGDTGIICPPNTSTVCLNDGGVMCMTDILLTNFCMNKTKTCVRTSLSCEMNRPCYKGNKNKKKDLPCISTATIYGDIMDVGHNVYKKVPASSRVYSDLEPVPGVNVNNTPVYHKAQQFCVTIVALPEDRKISEGEKILESSDSLFGKFASKLFGSW